MSRAALYEWLNEQIAAINDGTLEPVAIHDELAQLIAANPGALENDPAIGRLVERVGALVVSLEIDVRTGFSMSQDAATSPLVFSRDNRYLAAAGAREVVLVEVATGATTRRAFADLSAPPLRRGPGGFTPLDVVFADDSSSLYVTLCNDVGERDRSAPSAWIQLALPDLSRQAVEILDTSDEVRLLAIIDFDAR